MEEELFENELKSPQRGWGSDDIIIGNQNMRTASLINRGCCFDFLSATITRI